METGKMINRISNRLRRRSRRVQEYIGISGAQGMILDYILLESPMRPVYQKDIEQEFGLRPPTATQMLSTLEKKGLIDRIQETEDGRFKRIVFTKKAEVIKERLREEIEESERMLLGDISEEEQQDFLRLAGRMLENLDREEGR